MNQTERIADGRRRFFPAAGAVHDVLLRSRKGHSDVGLERGRDYEVETGGVSLRQVPPAGSTVIILTGDRVTTAGGIEPSPAELDSNQQPRRVGQPATVDLVPTIAAEAEQRAVDPPPWASTPPAPLVNAPAVAEPDPQSSFDLDALKRALVFATRDTNDATPRTPEWQDGLAKLTAIMLAAPTLEATQSAFLDIEKYLRGQA